MFIPSFVLFFYSLTVFNSNHTIKPSIIDVPLGKLCLETLHHGHLQGADVLSRLCVHERGKNASLVKINLAREPFSGLSCVYDSS